MKLKLTIINPDVDSGVRKEVVFEQQGGVIGRKQGNDWVLPDVKRFISSKHALIRFENNGFLLGDLSTNGIYLNGGASPIGNGNFVNISSGDQFKIGDYNILVSVEEVQAAVPEIYPSSDVYLEPDLYPSSSDVNIFPADMDPLDLLAPTPDESARPLESANGQSSDNAPVGQEFFQPPQFKPAVHDANAIPTNWADLPDMSQTSDTDPNVQYQGLSDRRATPAGEPAVNISPSLDRRNKNVAEGVNLKPQPDVVSSVASTGTDEAIKSFLKGVGLPPQALNQSDINEVMFGCGQVLRTTVQGLMEILSARARLKSEFRMNYTTIRVKENNPLKFSMSVDDALSNLFLKKGDDFLLPKEAIDEAVNNMKDHQIALLAGMQAALKELVDQFDPEDIEGNMEKFMDMSSKIPVYRKAKSWDVYCQNYSDFKRGMGDDFQNMFGRAFTEAYENQISKLSINRIKR